MVAFGSCKDKWGFNSDMAKTTGMGFKDIYRGLHDGRPARRWARSSRCTRPSSAWSSSTTLRPTSRRPTASPRSGRGDLNSDVGKSLLACDENGPMVMMVTNVVVDPAAGLVGVGRLFSGQISNGDAGLPAQLEAARARSSPSRSSWASSAR